MSKIQNFYNLGRGIASGKKGTGWMAYAKGDYKEETHGKTREERIDNYAEGWEETLQWEHEVGDKILDSLPGGKLTDDTLGEYSDKLLEYREGYTSYMHKLERKPITKSPSKRRIIKSSKKSKLPSPRYRYRKIKEGKQRLKFENSKVTEIVTIKPKKRKTKKKVSL